MMDEVEAFLRKHVEYLSGGNMSGLAGLFRAPLLVYHVDRVDLDPTEAHVRQTLQVTYDSMRGIGATDVGYRLIDVEMRTGTRTISCLLDFLYRNAAGKTLGLSRVRYFLEREGDTFRVAAVEYASAAFEKGIFCGRSVLH